MTLTDKETALVAELLSMAAAVFSNHGCNDLDLSRLGFTESGSADLWRRLAEWNGDRVEEFGSGMVHCDFVLMSYFADRLRGKVGR